MKSKLLLFAIVAITFFSSACKKECPITTYPIEGYWSGTYTDIGDLYSFTFVIEKGGSLVVADGASLGSSLGFGTWTLDGDVFTGSYQYGLPVRGAPYNYLLKATWTNDGKLLNGTWGVGDSYTSGGTFSMSRTN